MKWQRGYQSDYVDDQRGARAAGGGSAVGLLFLLFRTFGIGGVIVGLLVLGGMQLLGGGGALFSGPSEQTSAAAPVQDELAQFSGFVLDDVQNTWGEVMPGYRPARLTLFTQRVQSACGFTTAATGPFYCPGDQRVYIDLSFYQALRDRLGAPGDFAQAYVIAHEIGHHVQHLQGNLGRGREAGAAGGSVRVELQADCYAGVWAHHARTRQLLEIGDIEEAMRAAEAIGDDALQRGTGGAVAPDSFTHGTSAQRQRWFGRGLEQGTPAACDTFSATAL